MYQLGQTLALKKALKKMDQISLSIVVEVKEWIGNILTQKCPCLSLASPCISIILHVQHSEQSMWSTQRYVWLKRSIWSQLIRNLMISGAKSHSVRQTLDSSMFFWEAWWTVGEEHQLKEQWRNSSNYHKRCGSLHYMTLDFQRVAN